MDPRLDSNTDDNENMAIALPIIAWQAWQQLCRLSTNNRRSFYSHADQFKKARELILNLGATLLSGLCSMNGSTVYPQTRHTAVIESCSIDVILS